MLPPIDSKSIKPTAIKIHRAKAGGRIDYQLANGQLFLQLEQQHESFAIHSALEGWATALDFIQPLAAVEVLGADRFYCQGFGFAGPRGVMSLPRSIGQLPFSDDLNDNVRSYDSYLFTS